MDKLSLKKAPVFNQLEKAFAVSNPKAIRTMRPANPKLLDEMNKFHDEPLPESLAVPRTQCHGKWRNDIEQFNKEESE